MSLYIIEYFILEPHIGHLYSVLIGDAIARYQKLKNPRQNVKFMVGTDEHGLKVMQAAKNLKINEKSYCDQISSKYKCMFQMFDIGADDFIRTTEERHIETVTVLWVILKNMLLQVMYALPLLRNNFNVFKNLSPEKIFVQGPDL